MARRQKDSWSTDTDRLPMVQADLVCAVWDGGADANLPRDRADADPRMWAVNGDKDGAAVVWS